jgi:hypothetical protein
MPASRLREALTRPGVKSVNVESRPVPSSPRVTTGEFLVGLRVADKANAQADADAGVTALKAAADFHVTRVVGLETAPDGRAVAVVAGTLPLARLEKAMGLPEVVKIVPVGGPVAAPASAPVAPAPAPESLGGFMSFVLRRGPWLVLLTLILLLPSLRDSVRKLTDVFNPYR